MTMGLQRLRDLREDHDISQKELAEILFCRQQVYSRYERGIHDLPLWALIRLADFYHTSADYILGLTDVRDPYPRGSHPL